MSSDPFGGGYQEEKERIEREGFEVDWDDVLTDLEWGLPQAAAQAASVFSRRLEQASERRHYLGPSRGTVHFSSSFPRASGTHQGHCPGYLGQRR